MFFSKKYYNFIFPTLSAILMSFIMSGFITYINLGWSEEFLVLWFNAWGKSFLLAFPVSLFVIPLMKKLTDKITY